jgi:hypothetical protein
MTKQQTLEALMLLSALESLIMVDRKTVPDYIFDQLTATVENLSRQLFAKETE